MTIDIGHQANPDLVLYNIMQYRVNKALDEHSKSMSKHYENRVIYNAYVDEYTDNLDDIAVEGRVRFRMDAFGKGWAYESDVVEDPTWLTVAILANDMIDIVYDFQHVFLDGVCTESIFSVDEKSFIRIYNFVMGS